MEAIINLKPILIVDDIYIYHFLCYNKIEKTEKYNCKIYKTNYLLQQFYNIRKGCL